ncbi:hypothetical protein AB0I68_04520 [Streptomyces sp. NPDC050448]|uniref:hypothetical protein n=1 Tax=Streptomyces sp. NPDC050448 TaxID=3155404 RepID=UPI00342DEDF8
MITLIAVLLALPAGAFLLVKAVHLGATRRPGMSRSAFGQWSEGAWACLCVAVISFALGSFSGFDPRPTRPCIEELTAQYGPQSYRTPDADIAIERRHFPVSTVCTFPDGIRVQVVPGWVNPLLVGSLAGVAACAVVAVRVRRRPGA